MGIDAQLAVGEQFGGHGAHPGVRGVRGADCPTRPVALPGVVARVRALGRRGNQLLADRSQVADLGVDLIARQVVRSGRPIALTAKEFALLEFFIRNTNAVVDRAAITAKVWDENHDPSANTLEALVRRLRAKIDDAFEPKLIHTLRGAGYRFGVDA